MRNVLTFLICLIPFFEAWSQDAFYYCGDEKILLKEVSGKEVLIIPADDAETIQLFSSIPGKEINGHNKKIKITAKNTGASLKKMGGKSPKVMHTESCYTDGYGQEVTPTGTVNIKLKKEEDYPLLEKRATELGLDITEQNEFMPLWYEVVIPLGSELSTIETANRLYELGEFAACEPAFSFDPRLFSFDPDVDQQWGLYNSTNDGIDINILPAWGYATGVGIKIAIIDSGVDVTHDDLAPNIHSSYDCATKKPSIKVFEDHGTHCAGIAAAVRNNGINIAGVAPDAKLMCARVNFDNYYNSQAQLANGINWAWTTGADVISCSWYSPDSQLIKDAIDNALTSGRSKKGCVIVVASGNSKDPNNMGVKFPANYRKEVLAVGAIESDGMRCDFSCFGESLFVCAPGKDILSTGVGNRVIKLDGTSMATPHVSGVAALILQRNPKMTANKVREIMAKSTNWVGDRAYTVDKEFGKWNKWYGYGLIDAYKAVMNTPRN